MVMPPVGKEYKGYAREFEELKQIQSWLYKINKYVSRRMTHVQSRIIGEIPDLTNPEPIDAQPPEKGE